MLQERERQPRSGRLDEQLVPTQRGNIIEFHLQPSKVRQRLDFGGCDGSGSNTVAWSIVACVEPFVTIADTTMNEFYDDD